MRLSALIDSNVVVAALAESHVHHEESVAILGDGGLGELAVSAHSYAEAYNVLTRKGERAPLQFTPTQA